MSYLTVDYMFLYKLAMKSWHLGALLAWIFFYYGDLWWVDGFVEILNQSTLWHVLMVT